MLSALNSLNRGIYLSLWVTISQETTHPPTTEESQEHPCFGEHRACSHIPKNQFQLTRLEKVSMPLSCVRRLDRNIPPLRDKSTPARAWSSSDLIYCWKNNGFKHKQGLLYKEGFSSEAPYWLHRCAGSEHSAVSRSATSVSIAPPARLQGHRSLCSQHLGSHSCTEHVLPEESFSITS